MKKQGEPLKNSPSLKTETLENRFAWLLAQGWGNIEAYREAGYKASTDRAAGQGANRLLKRPRVQALINQQQQHILANQSITTQKVADELAAIAFSDILDYATIDDFSLDDTIYNDDTEEDETVTRQYRRVIVKKTSEMKHTKAISSIKQTKYGIEIKLWDKMKALELLGNYLKMFTMPPQNPEDELDYSQYTSEELLTLYKLTQKAKRA